MLTVWSMPDADKKELERRIIEVTQQRCAFFPSGELSEFERPNWLIPSACLGIEVSQLLPEQAAGARFSPPELSRFQQQVVAIAACAYRELPGTGPVDVLVYITNEWRHKNDADAMGHALAEFVRSNYPSDGDAVTLDDETPDGFSSVRILAREGGWQAGSFNNVEGLTYERLNSCIVEKSHKVAGYRARLPAGWQVWLLLATRVPVLWSLSCPPEVTTWRTASEFDRVFLNSWECGRTGDYPPD